MGSPTCDIHRVHVLGILSTRFQCSLDLLQATKGCDLTQVGLHLIHATQGCNVLDPFPNRIHATLELDLIYMVVIEVEFDTRGVGKKNQASVTAARAQKETAAPRNA